jgi:hypothetical protein
MSKKTHTPMQEVMFQLETTNSSVDFVLWMQKNIARLLYEEKYLVVDTYDKANDPYRCYRESVEKTKGQEFFENNFINL